MEPAKSRRRCAIYTHKSSEEGLEQDFNSLHAQRQACEAYVKSQAGEGWLLVKTAYDDGGYSGGSMERPALQSLLDGIRQKLIDVVVVYKVDRLTRSLADFAKMVEVFDAQGVSFVSVTQQFNTTTSMGRLTLNVLLSFAQFEREVTGERIRDTIAASKRKGIWIGGTTPLGYDVKDRRLVLNRAEAATVEQIYERYLELGSVRLLKQNLDRRGVSSKIRVSMKGLRSGGRSFSRGALYELLANSIYVGEIRHKRERHLGLHDAILERDLRERVQQRLRDQAGQRSRRTTKAGSSPLAGLLFDLVERVELPDQGIRISIKLPVRSIGYAEVPLANVVHLSRLLPLKMKRRDVETRIVLEGSTDTPRNVEPALLKAIARATQWVDQLATGQVRSLAEVSRREGLPKRYVERITKLAFLAPRIIEAVVEGRASTHINLQMLMDGRFELSPEWSEQHQFGRC